MKRLGAASILMCAALPVPAAYAATSAVAHIQVECTGRPRAQVAVRWGHPNHDVGEYMPIFAVPCGVGIRTANPLLLDRDSEFEVQTEGGIETT